MGERRNYRLPRDAKPGWFKRLSWGSTDDCYVDLRLDFDVARLAWGFLWAGGMFAVAVVVIAAWSFLVAS